MHRPVPRARRPLATGLAALAVAGLTLTAGSTPATAATAQPFVGVPAAAGSGLTSLSYWNGAVTSPRAYYVDNGDGVHELKVPSSGSWTDLDISSQNAAIQTRPGSPLASLPLSNERIYYFSSDGHLQELAAAFNWQVDTDVTRASGGVAASSTSPLAAISVSGNPRVYYITATGRIEEMAWGNGWHATDVTAGGPAAAPGSRLTAVALGSSPRVYYTSTAGHVIELSWGGGWHANDVSASTGATAAEAGSSLSSVVFNGNPLVCYTAVGGHVHQLAYSGGWHHSDVTGTIAGAVPAAPRASLTTVNALDRGVRTYFTSADGHVRELITGVPRWSSTDVTVGSGGAPNPSGGALTSTVVPNPSSPSLPSWNVFQTTAAGHIQRLYGDTGHWYAQDITAL
ncbi:hypothetical protein [Krasilnikovia sp. MM14-A1004]|uniref:hypothetical protein n=1 Tax=Krasilnikovia sp. MM14-A1004 TaxID=3373541 RepID=UPI00399C65E5